MTVCPISLYGWSGNRQTRYVNDIAVIHLHGKRGGFVIVDADMFEALNQHRWCLDSLGYAAGHLQGQKGHNKIRMHRLVNGTPPKTHTDHINGYKIDNTRRNLRSCSYAENMRNQRVQSRPKTSGFKGVCFDKRGSKWMAYFGTRATRTYLGRFTNEKDAASAYNVAAKKRYGDYALLNEI